MVIAGIDIGNSTTEVCISQHKDPGQCRLLVAEAGQTTGYKGTLDNIKGIEKVLVKALEKGGLSMDDLDLIRLNEAAPVIGDTAMETITETIISDSTMIGHNPNTPAGSGVQVGMTVRIDHLKTVDRTTPLLVVVPEEVDYEQVAKWVNTSDKKILGMILQKDEAVLVYNRLNNKIPIVDEVASIEKIPEYVTAAIEVAPLGQAVKTLSNPYGIAKCFHFGPQETQLAIPVAKSLIGKKSAVVIKTSKENVQEKQIDVGDLVFKGKEKNHTVSIAGGAEEIMKTYQEVTQLEDIEASPGSYIETMLIKMKQSLASMAEDSRDQLKIKDLLALDTFVPVKVKGALAGEVAMEKAVAIAAMVQADRLPMERIAQSLEARWGIETLVGGVEAVMASLGALTTPGTTLPMTILDLGGGSTDAAYLNEKGEVKTVHLAGAGAFVTLLINKELALDNEQLAEWIKIYPLAKVDSFYQMTLENGEVIFFKEPIDPRYYGHVILLKEDEWVLVESPHSKEKIMEVRKEVKRKVFVSNALRALEKVAPDKNLRQLTNVVIVGGSALDLEIPDFIQEALADYNVLAGRGDIQGYLGPRNAVATGLALR